MPTSFSASRAAMRTSDSRQIAMQDLLDAADQEAKKQADDSSMLSLFA